MTGGNIKATGWDPSIFIGGFGKPLVAAISSRLVARPVAAAATAASRAATKELVATHGQTLSKKAMDRLTSDIAENGIKEPLKYVEHNGAKYVVDGHHRLMAARRLGMESVPAEQVSLPFRGYRTAADLTFGP